MVDDVAPFPMLLFPVTFSLFDVVQLGIAVGHLFYFLEFVYPEVASMRGWKYKQVRDGALDHVRINVFFVFLPCFCLACWLVYIIASYSVRLALKGQIPLLFLRCISRFRILRPQSLSLL